MQMNGESSIIIKVHHLDNVAIVANAGGLKSGSRLADGTLLVDDVPYGHKVALTEIDQDAAIIRYGEVIGHAAEKIARGRWVHESLVRQPEPPALEELSIATRPDPVLEPLTGKTFEGYRNADGSVGTKNILAITTSVQCVAGVTNYLVGRIKEELLPLFPNVDDVVALNHHYGCGVAINAPAAVIPIRTLQNITRNPNFGGEVMVLGLGCEKLAPERLLPPEYQVCNDSCSPVMTLQDTAYHGFSDMVTAMMSFARQHLVRLNQRTRETCPASDLVVGLQCGGSDSLSGLTANPAVGVAADLIVQAGGSVMFSEVTEVRDAIHLLTPRAIDKKVGQALLREMAWYDNYLEQGGADCSANPTPGNKEGGLTNIVEKALGSIAKSGSTPIVDILGPGERIRLKGLTFAATPASDFVCGTLQLASGMNMQVFTTGRGTPYGLAMVPVIKVSTNTTLARRWHDLIDLDAGQIATGTKSIHEVGQELFELILDVASGRKQVCSDRLKLHNDLVLFNPAPIT
jgi:galactarate dehydratase